MEGTHPRHKNYLQWSILNTKIDEIEGEKQKHEDGEDEEDHWSLPAVIDKSERWVMSHNRILDRMSPKTKKRIEMMQGAKDPTEIWRTVEKIYQNYFRKEILLVNRQI